MRKLIKGIVRLAPLLILLLGLGSFFYFGFYHYLNFTNLKQHRFLLQQWTQQHYVWVVLVYMAIYTLLVAISVPGAVILTLTGGFLFGLVAGTIYVVISATLGAVLVFLAVKTALGKHLAARASSWLGRMKQGFQQNAFSYLLLLRLIPIFPFWLVNLVPALLQVRLITFISATFLGIIPGSFVYVWVGQGLNSLITTEQAPDLKIIFSPSILLPLLALAVLAVLPVIYQKIKTRKEITGEMQP